ncbi:MAG: hypothetical protein COA79_14915 [Planctomycetota bacterium]|nr:MAG: hypothetical protein COA79_14915 [Planctomycetota bacterium]
MYTKYWKLTDNPFKNTPDTNVFYFSAQHENALTKMFYTLLENRGAMLLTGECGCGKTLISRLFYQELRARRDKYHVVHIDNPNLTHIELLNEILFQLGSKNIGQQDKGKLLQLINQKLSRYYNNNEKVVVIVDEVQNIQSKSSLEELRLLLNHHRNNDYMLTLFLIGQPEFNDIVHKFPQLDQRISLRFHLKPFSLNDSVKFVDYKIRKAGGDLGSIFQASAIKEIFEASRGIPRIINNLCDTALLTAYNLKKEKIDKDLIRQVLKDQHIIKL